MEVAAVDDAQVPAAEATLRILTFLAGQRGPVAAATIAAAIGAPRSTTYHLLAALDRHGFVLHLRESRRYGLGIAAFELSSGYSRQEPLTRLGVPVIAALADRLGESAHLAVLHGRDVVYLVEERARHRRVLVTDVGVRLPAHLTASGRAMLAALPAAQLRALYPDAAAFVTRNAAGPAGPADLRRLLATAAQDGFATEEGSVTAGLTSIAAVVLGPNDWPVASVAVTFETQGTADRARILQQVRRAAATLSRRVGGSIGDPPNRPAPTQKRATQ